MNVDLLLTHLDAAYSLARWLMGNAADAEDVVQQSYLRALSGADSFRGGDARAWLLTIVRNGCHSAHRHQRVRVAADFDETQHSDPAAAPTPEQLLIAGDQDQRVRDAVASLGAEFREVIVLREFEGLSYKEIADVVAAPVGTVMSRLSRARERLRALLTEDGPS